MDTKAFAYFEAVCRHGGFSGAARELGISKQALSSFLARLSEEQGVSLLDVGSAGVAPTSYGRIFLGCCRDVNERLARLARELETERAHLSNILRVGFVAGSLTFFGETMFEEFAERPGAGGKGEVLAVVYAEGGELERALLGGEVDFAVLRHPPAAGVMAVPLVRDTMFFWVGRNNPLSRKATLTLDDLAGQRLAVLRFGDRDQAAADEIARAGAKGAEIVFFDEMIDVFEESLAGRALGFTTRQRVERIPVPGLAAVPYSGLKLEYLLCYDSGRAVSEVDAAFLDFMRGKARFFW